MGNELLTPTELEPRKERPTEEEPELLYEADGSMWSSLVSNLRDAFAPVKQAPLELSSKPVDVVDPTEEEPIWKTLGAGIQDLFFPKKLAPLELTSKPINVVDPMEVKRSPLSSALAFGLHVLVIGLILFFFYSQWKTRAIERKAAVTAVDVKPFIPMTMKMNQSMGGGGGGGAHELVEASKGHLPKMAKTQITPPQIIRNDHPKLAVDPTIVMPQVVKLPDAPNMPNVGVPQSPQVALASQGGGSGPQIIFSVDPEFSDEARRAKYQGICMVSVIVDAQGNPQRVHVVRPLGMGLDEKAVAAVKQYKFKPAYYQGKPVAVEVNIEVNFRIY